MPCIDALVEAAHRGDDDKAAADAEQPGHEPGEGAEASEKTSGTLCPPETAGGGVNARHSVVGVALGAVLQRATNEAHHDEQRQSGKKHQQQGCGRSVARRRGRLW